MPITLQKRGSILLIEGLDISKPGEYISENAATFVQNFRVSRGLLTKRYGTILSGSEVTADSYLDAYTKLLIHFDGVDSATAYTAETGQTVTFEGTAQLDTAQKKFGLSSLLLDGNSDYVTVPDSDDWYFDGDFTIDCWFCFNAVPDEEESQAICGQYVDEDNRWRISISRSTGENFHKISLRHKTSSSDTIFFTKELSSLLVADTQYHLAVVRSGNNFYIFLDGEQVSTTEVDSDSWVNIVSPLYIGKHGTGYYFNGWIDEFRISKGIARWTSDFSVLERQYGDTEIMAGRELTREGIRYNIRIGLETVEYYQSGISDWTDITGKSLTGSTNDLVDTAVPVLSGKRILCIANGIDAIRKWTGTGNTEDLGGTPPVAKFIQEYKTYLVCAHILGGTDIAQRVQWCDTADPETWDSGNAGSVDLIEDGEDITGLSLFGDYVSVHKPSSIYLGSLVSSNDIFRFDRRSVGKGTIANHTIINLPTGEQIYLADDGLRLFNGVSAPLVSSTANEEIRDGLNKEYAFKSWAVLVSEEDEVWIGIPIGSETTPDTIYKYNYVTGKLYKDTRTSITAAWRAITAQSSVTWDELVGSWDEQTWRWNDAFVNASFTDIFFGDISGNAYKVDRTSKNDGSAEIEAIWSGKDYQGDEIGQMCRWLELQLWAKGSGTLTVEYSPDRGNTWYEASGSPYTLGADFPDDDTPAVFYFDIVSSKLRPRFSISGTDTDLAIKQFKIGYKAREFRR